MTAEPDGFWSPMEQAVIDAVDRRAAHKAEIRELVRTDEDRALQKEWREMVAALREHAENYLPDVFDWLDGAIAAGTIEGLLGYKDLTDPLEKGGNIGDCLDGLLMTARRYVPAPVLLVKDGAE